MEKLSDIFSKYHFQIIEESDNYLKLQSQWLIVIISHNKFENSNILWLGKANENIGVIEIDNHVLLSFFHTKLILSQVPTEVFISNLYLFFENEGKSLLDGDLNKLNELDKFDLQRSKSYTDELIKNQSLASANNAWDNGNYEEFINILDNLDMNSLLSSYRLKYRIAVKKRLV